MASFVSNLRAATKGTSTVRSPSRRSTTRRIRASARPTSSKRVRLQLVEVDGVMEWEETTDALPDMGLFRSGRKGARRSEDAVAELEFDRLPPSEVTKFLLKKDRKLTPHRGLRRYNPKTGRLAAAAAPPSGTALLLIHGTFSNCNNVLKHFTETSAGQDFLKKATRRYRAGIFTFDHPTLAVSPILNAMDLLRDLAGSKAKFDVVAHSRGGLVTRWWCEAIDPTGRQCRRAVLVGSPLAGTGLAAPPNIRGTINMLTKFGDLLETAAGLGSYAVPVLAVVETLLKVLTSVTSFAAKTPLVDAIIAMVPGLFAMSRVGNNPELLRLLEIGAADPDRYYCIKSNFEPTDPAWQFWRAFRKDRIKAAAADVVFKADNDLVVDTGSMNKLARSLKIPDTDDRTLDFGDSPTVHHMNYFRQPETMEFLADTLL